MGTAVVRVLSRVLKGTPLYIDAAVPLSGLQLSVRSLNALSGVSWGTSLDPVVELIMARSFMLLPQVRASSFYGTGPYISDPIINQSEFHLPLVRKAYNPDVDYHNYGNRILALFAPPFRGPAQGERNLIHVKMVGEVRPVGVGLYSTYNQGIPYNGTVIKAPSEISSPSTSGSLRGYYTNTPGNPGFGVLPGSLYMPGCWGELCSTSRQIQGVLGSIPGSNHFVHDQREWNAWSDGYNAAQDFAFKRISATTYAITYTGFCYSGVYCIKSDRRILVDLARVWRSGNAYNAYGLNLSAQLDATYTDVVTHYIRNGSQWDPLPYYGIEKLVTTKLSRVVDRLFPAGKAYTADGAHATRLAMERNLKFLWSGVSPRAREYRRAAPFATNDAVVSFKSTSNFIEALIELPGITGLLVGSVNWDAVTQFIHKYLKSKDVHGGDFTTTAASKVLIGLADYVAGSYLLRRFGVQPTQGDLENVQDAERRLRWSAEVLRSTPTARGKKTFQDRIKGFKGKVFDITVRSKFEIPPPKGVDILRLLQLDNLGVFPSPSRIWNSLPLSFLFDYVLKMGKRWEVIESFLFCMLMGVSSFTHTYRVSATVNESWLPHRVSLPNGQIYAEVYIRETSCLTPDFARDGDLNLAPPRGPDGPLLLALLWAFARATILRFL